MSSEASKIRNQCAKKYGVREKAYKEQIASLLAKLDEKDEILADYTRMQREYVKLLCFIGLSEEERKLILRSAEMQLMEEQLRGLYGGMTSLDLSKITMLMRGGNLSLEEAIKRYCS